PPPLIFICDRDDLDARLHAARAGGIAYITRPVKTSTLVEKLDALSVQATREPYRILIVEDSAEQAALCSTVLRQAGMLTSVVSDPRHVLGQLLEFRPDL